MHHEAMSLRSKYASNVPLIATDMDRFVTAQLDTLETRDSPATSS